LSKFRGTFHSFDPVGFAIFAICEPFLSGETIRIRKIGEGRLGGAGSAMLFSVAAAI
jgi:hypothetical protein